MTKSKKYSLFHNLFSNCNLLLLWIALSLLSFKSLFAQEVKLSIGNKSYQISRLDVFTYVAKKDSTTLVIMPIDTLSRLVERVRILQERIKRDSVEIASQMKLIQNYEAYKSAADTNLVRQKALIAISDSISSGYKKLYYDLKSISGASDYRLLLGFGGWRVRDDLNIYGHLGLGYRDWQFIFNYGFSGNSTNSLSIIKVFGF